MNKKKKALTRQQRNAILQSLQKSSQLKTEVGNSSSVARDGQAVKNNETVSDKIYTSQIQIDTNNFINELKKIAIIGGIIIIILSGTIVINQKTDYLVEVGSYITSKIGL